MPDLPQTLRLVYDAAGPYPRDVPLADVYLDAAFPAGAGDRPFLYVNMVQTFDGQAILQDSAYTIGTDVDHFLLRQLRVHADAVLYGTGTLRKDDVVVVTHRPLQERRLREGRSPNPLAIVVTGTAEFSDEVLAKKHFFRRTDFERLIVTTSRASAAAIERVRGKGVAVEVAEADPSGEVDLARLLRRLHGRGIRRVLCEGGPTLNVSLARAGAIDEMFVTTTLRLGGDPDAPRILPEPVSARPLDLLSVLMYVSAEGLREMYFRFKFPRP
jgi:riboflavin biosynthesis pyrimidine reductase